MNLIVWIVAIVMSINYAHRMKLRSDYLSIGGVPEYLGPKVGCSGIIAAMAWLWIMADFIVKG